MKELIDMDNKLKIIACFDGRNKPYQKQIIQKKDLYIPILGGKKLYTGNDSFLLSLQGDDQGNNISDLNPYINQMTVIYWALANYDKIGNPEYFGTAHYHRLLRFNENQLEQNTIFVNCQVYNYVMPCDNVITWFIGKKLFNEQAGKIVLYKVSEKYPEILPHIYNGYLYNRNCFVMHKKYAMQYFQYLKYCLSIVIPLINVKLFNRQSGFLMQFLTGMFIAKLEDTDNVRIRLSKRNY